MGQTIRMYLPDVGAFTDQAANDWDPDDVNPSFVDVPFGQRPGKGILIRDFEQFQTCTDIIDQFIDPMFKRACEYANAQIFAQVNTTNFSTYGAITTLPAELDVLSARLAWNILTRNKVPVVNPDNSTILYHPDVHQNTLTDPAWSQENLVSAVLAREARQDVAQPGSERVFPMQGVGADWPPTRRSSSAAASTSRQPPARRRSTGTAYNWTNGSTAVTATNSKFTTEVAATVTAPTIGNTAWIRNGSDVDANGNPLYYPVASVASDTALTLAIPFGGTTTTTGLATRMTYTGVAMHRFAICLAVRPLEVDTGAAVKSRIMNIKGLPIRMCLSYQHLKAGWLLTMDYGMVCKVIRPDFGVIFNS